MTTAGAVWVDVLPSMKGFGSALRRDVRSSATAAGRDMSGALGAAGGDAGSRAGREYGSRFSGAATVAMKGFVAAGAGLAGLAGYGLKIAAANEQAQISFETMLGSASKAQTFLGELRDFAAKTPFEFPELQTAASSLISVGVSADKVIPIMTSLGNATSGMGTGSEGIRRATYALQQMSAAGRISAEDLNQLRDAGIPVFDLLAKATGKTTEQVVAMKDAGALGKKEMQQLFAALETGAGLERFTGLMDKQSQSLNGMLATFKDTFGQGLATAIEPAIPTVKRALEGLTGALGYFLNTIVPAFVDFGRAVRDNIGPIAAVASGLASMLIAHKVAVAFTALRTAVALSGGALAAAGGALAVLTAPVTLVVLGVGALTAAMVLAYQRSSTFREFIGQLGEKVKEFGGFVTSTILPALRTFAGVIGNNLRPIVTQLGETFRREILPQFRELWETVSTKVWPTLKRFGVILGVVTAAAIFMWSKFAGLVIPIIMKLAGPVLGGLMTGFNFLIKVIVAVSTVASKVMSAIITVVGKMVDFVLGAAEKIARALGKDGLADDLKRTREEFKKTAEAANRALNSIDDKTVTVGINLNASAVQALKTAGYQVSTIGAAGYRGSVKVRDRRTGAVSTLARGGPVGRGFGSRDDVPALLTRGEHVLTTSDVRAMGGHENVFRLREAARAGVLAGFARGGPVDISVATEIPGAAIARRIAQMRQARDMVAQGVGRRASEGLSRKVNERLAARLAEMRASGATGSAPAYNGAYRFPLPAGSYRVGMPPFGYPGHAGQDYPAPTGTPVFAPFSGYFNPVSLGNRSYGNYANLVAGNLRWIGAHLSGFSRGAGYVQAGERLGSVGSTGNSTGPHLHSELRRSGQYTDPRALGGGGSTSMTNTRQLETLRKQAAAQPPSWKVYIGERDITDIVRVEQDRRDLAFADGIRGA